MLLHAREQTADELAGLMAKVDVLPKMRNAFVRAGMANIISAKHTRREFITGTLAPLGRFRGPIAVYTNASMLHLVGPGLSPLQTGRCASGRSSGPIAVLSAHWIRL